MSFGNFRLFIFNQYLVTWPSLDVRCDWMVSSKKGMTNDVQIHLSNWNDCEIRTKNRDVIKTVANTRMEEEKRNCQLNSVFNSTFFFYATHFISLLCCLLLPNSFFPFVFVVILFMTVIVNQTDFSIISKDVLFFCSPSRFTCRCDMRLNQLFLIELLSITFGTVLQCQMCHR